MIGQLTDAFGKVGKHDPEPAERVGFEPKALRKFLGWLGIGIKLPLFIVMERVCLVSGSRLSLYGCF